MRYGVLLQAGMIVRSGIGREVVGGQVDLLGETVDAPVGRMPVGERHHLVSAEHASPGAPEVQPRAYPLTPDKGPLHFYALRSPVDLEGRASGSAGAVPNE